jgi:hypothetical protein
MKRFASLLVALLALAAPARAQVLWVVPGPPSDGRPTATVIFSDNLKPGPADLLKKVAGSEVLSRDLHLESVRLKLTEDKAVLRVGVTQKGPQMLAAVCATGVSQKGDASPELVYFYAKSFADVDLKAAPPPALLKPLDNLKLEIVPVLKKKNTVQVLWMGKPLPDAQVVLYVPGKDKEIEGRTTAEGFFTVEKPEANGVYGIRGRHVEKTNGEYQGKKYTAIRHVATLTFPVEKFAKE